MNGRVDPELRSKNDLRAHTLADVTAAPTPALGLPVSVPALAPASAFDADADLGHALPPDHPAWVRDTVSISQRARAVLTAVRPVVMRVMTLWDHAVRSIVIGGRRLEVDASGSYRMP